MKNIILCLYAIILVLGACVRCWSGEADAWTSALTVPAGPIQVFARTECHKYWHFMNYLHWWNDRPLALDRSLRPAAVDGALVTPGSDVQAVATSLLRDAELSKGYLLDGLASFGSTSWQEPAYELYLGALAAGGTTGYKQLVEVGNSLTDLTYTRLALAKALASPYAARINGKVLVSSYALDRDGPDRIASQLQVLHGEFGAGFILVVEMTAVTEEMLRLYHLGQLSTSPSAKLTELKQSLRRYLDVADGIMVESVHHMEAETASRYDNRFDLAFYRDCLIPIFKSVLAEPAYAGKLLGLSAASGYCNNRTGDNNSEECTRRLRNTLEVAINAGPQFMILPEWNEQNENTSLQPTINNSWTHRRICEYYLRTVKGLPLAPREGDDTTLPNCILSYRKDLKIGEALELEVLNVPDSAASSPYTATLSLETPAGDVVAAFAPMAFNRAVLGDHTITVASETLAATPILRPVITIQQTTAPASRTFRDGLLHITLRPSWSIDYQTVKQPLRDIAMPAVCSLQAVGGSGRDVVITGSVSGVERIRSIEVLAGASEVFAYDRLNEYDPAHNLIIAGSYTTLPGGYDVDLSVTGSPSFEFKPVYMPESIIPYQRIGATIRFAPAERIREWPGRFYLLIPKTSQASAVITVASSHGSFSVPVADIVANGVISRTPAAQLVMRFEDFHMLPDHPVAVDAASASFTATLRADDDHPVYHMRVVTESGRIHRSKPIVLSLGQASTTVPVRVTSEVHGGSPVTVQVPRRDVLDLRYEFDSRCGDALPTAAGPRWFAQLGGGTLYADPFYAGNGGYPASNPLSKPSFATEDGAPSLHFSGNGQYLVLPTEAFPRGAFTLTFDIKPMVTTPQVLFRHHGILIGSLMLKLKDGRLFASYISKLIQESYFDTGLAVPVGQWSRIVVTYDLAQLSFQVDQQPARTYPFTGTALYFQPSVFGGHLRAGFGVEAGDGFFNGFLRALSITHATGLPSVGNTAPVANAQVLTTVKNTAKSIILTGSDPDGDLLTASVASAPTHGTLSGTAPQLVYTPSADYLGSDSFVFSVNDGTVTSAQATIVITTLAAEPSGSGANGPVGAPSGSGHSGCGLGSPVAALVVALGLGFRRRVSRYAISQREPST